MRLWQGCFLGYWGDQTWWQFDLHGFWGGRRTACCWISLTLGRLSFDWTRG